MRRRLPCACLALALALAGCAARDEGPRALYQWTDAAGHVRYTTFPEEIPGAQQHTRRPVEAGAPARSARRPPVPTPVDVAARAPEPPAETPAEASLDARIAELEARIATEQEALKALISDPATAASLRDSPDLRAIGDRLPALQSELEDLRQQRAEAAAGDAP